MRQGHGSCRGSSKRARGTQRQQRQVSTPSTVVDAERMPRPAPAEMRMLAELRSLSPRTGPQRGRSPRLSSTASHSASATSRLVPLTVATTSSSRADEGQRCSRPARSPCCQPTSLTASRSTPLRRRLRRARSTQGRGIRLGLGGEPDDRLPRPAFAHQRPRGCRRSRRASSVSSPPVSSFASLRSDASATR